MNLPYNARSATKIGLSAPNIAAIAISGSTMEPVFYGFLLLMSGIPVYAWAKIKHII